MRLGILGLSKGNGHPFSFSAIINGYSDAGLRAAGWPGIYSYVKKRKPSEFGFQGVRVTHAWTQNEKTTQKLCRASRIPYGVGHAREMIGHVDAVILARDDYENHWSMAESFLRAGLPVLIDKPLSLSSVEIKKFTPYLKNGQLMSCSSLRYASELDKFKKNIAGCGKILLVRGAVLNSWEKYGIHLLEGVFSVIKAKPVAVTALDSSHESVAIVTQGGPLVQIDALGENALAFNLEFYGTRGNSFHSVSDNFSMFRRMLFQFIRMAKTGKPVIEPSETLNLMRLLIAGRKALNEKRKVGLHEAGF